jgi:hypothetical protein
VSTIRLFGVAALDGEGHAPLAPGTSVIAFRDLGAVVGSADLVPTDVGDAEIEQYHTVIDWVFARQSVLPAPLGILFRSEETLLRWMELHYVVLSEGLSFVDGRCQVRVHIIQDLKTAAATGADLNAIATESFRLLRRNSVAAVPLKGEPGTSEVFSAAFLIVRDRLSEFADLAAEEGKRRPELRVEISGPWPPYDFVRMQFGA